MAVYKIKTKQGKMRWRAEVCVGFKLDGSKDIRTRTCETRKKAEKAEFDLKVLKEGLGGKSDRMTLKRFWDEYYHPIKSKALRGTTMQRYESTWKCHLSPAFGDVNMNEIDRLRIQRLLLEKSSYKVAKNTRDLLRQILGEALQMGAIKSNPAAGRFSFPEKKESDPDRYGECVSDIHEHQRMISLASGDTRLMLVLGLCFGLRKEEVLGLNWEDVDFKNNCIHIRRAYVYSNGENLETSLKTPESRRDIPMTKYARCELERLRGDAVRIGMMLIHGNERLSPRDAKEIISEWVKANDVPRVTLFSLRHSYATAMIKSGMDVGHLSKILGHTTIVTTYNRYVKPVQKDLEQAVSAMDSAYSKAL